MEDAMRGLAYDHISAYDGQALARRCFLNRHDHLGRATHFLTLHDMHETGTLLRTFAAVDEPRGRCGAWPDIALSDEFEGVTRESTWVGTGGAGFHSLLTLFCRRFFVENFTRGWRGDEEKMMLVRSAEMLGGPAGNREKRKKGQR